MTDAHLQEWPEGTCCPRRDGIAGLHYLLCSAVVAWIYTLDLEGPSGWATRAGGYGGAVVYHATACKESQDVHCWDEKRAIEDRFSGPAHDLVCAGHCLNCSEV